MKSVIVRFLLVAGLAAGLPAYAADEKIVAAVTVSVEGEFFTVSAKDATVQEVMDRLQEAMPVDLEIPSEILKERVSLDLKDVTYEQVIEKLAGSHALVYERVGEGYRLVSAQLTTHQDYVPPTLDKLSRADRKNVQAKSTRVQELVTQHGEIETYAGELDYDQAKALIEERKAKVAAIIDQLVALGPGGARAINGEYAGAGTKMQAAMVEALARIDDPEASAVLGSLFATDDRYSLQKEMVASLGHRAEPQAEKILKDILASEDDERLRGTTVAGLGGRPGAVPELAKIVTSKTESRDVIGEAINAIGRTGTDEAADILLKTASAPGDLTIRKTAIQEYARSWGEKAVPQLETLLQDSDESIRQSTIRALGKIGTDGALAVLRTVATSDVSSIIRDHATATLTQHGVAVAPN